MKFTIKLLVLLAFLIVYSPVSANDLNNLHGFQQNEAYAGAYLTFKFGGNLKKAEKNRLKYGFSVGLRWQNFSFSGIQEFSLPNEFNRLSTNSLFTKPRLRELRVFDTSFDSAGFKSVNFANVPVFKRGKNGEIEFIKLGLDENEKDGVEPGTILKWGLIIWGGILVLGAIAFATADFNN